jgi:hypothetical protein
VFSIDDMIQEFAERISRGPVLICRSSTGSMALLRQLCLGLAHHLYER